MKKMLILIALILIITMVMPLVVVKLPIVNEEEEVIENAIASDKVKVYIKNEDRVEEMDSMQYLKEVVSAEMPADFHEEALKAQAVAARTYLVNRRRLPATDIHKGADICTDSAHCKAWIKESERRESWGNMAEENWQKISDAVEKTDGIIITYEGEPISAVFHSTSSGVTENAIDVWGGSVPYLVSVESLSDKESPKYSSEQSFSIDEFKKLSEEKIEGVDWNKGLFSDIYRSGAGGIIKIKIGGVEVKGTEFRNIFSLRSTNVSIKEEEGKVFMSVKGYGHGVGMSQYGANYLAYEGKNYIEILKTYYTGVEVKNVYE